MTASTEASSDSDTDVDGEAVVDHLPHDDATDDTAPGQDAGVGPASLAFTSFLLAMLCLSPFYMLGSNLWDLINGRGLLLGQALSSLTLHVAGFGDPPPTYLTLGIPRAVAKRVHPHRQRHPDPQERHHPHPRHAPTARPAPRVPALQHPGRGEHRAAQRDRGARVSHVVCHLDELLAARGMTLVELSEKVGVTTVNLSVLKNDRAKAIRYSTLCAICEALSCSVGELLEVGLIAP